MCENVHTRCIEPNEERLACLCLFVNKSLGSAEKFLINSRHPFCIEGTSIFNFLRTVCISITVYHAAGSVFFLELRIFRVEISFWLLLCIEVIKISEEFIETMHGR